MFKVHRTLVTGAKMLIRALIYQHYFPSLSALEGLELQLFSIYNAVTRVPEYMSGKFRIVYALVNRSLFPEFR